MTDYRKAAIERYLKEFDRQASGVPRQQRRRMRGEIAAHLEEAIPAGASEMQVSAALTDFGTVDEVLEQADAAGQEGPKYRRRLRVVIVVIVVIVVVGIGLALMPLLFAGAPAFP